MKGLIAALILTPCLTIADTFEYGWLPVIGAYKSTLDADTEVVVTANALSGLILIDTGRSTRLWIQGQYHSLDFDGNQTEIGQEVAGLEIAAIYQTQTRISRHFKPWFGVGASISVLEFKNRFLTDNQGFLAQTFADQSKAGLTIDFNFTTATDWLDQYDSGFAIRLSVPVNDVLTKLEAGFYIIF